ncbi:hypothetical protein ABFS82_14G136300 [Erythranthe guttata]|nr:PREDICTED: probable WRKY transcription factor 53 [Erythranthe guttata]|eukprot:XP_012835649.1 PREDICTED: probable WRKY transcription factor 53 [Erythranthe guttata]
MEKESVITSQLSEGMEIAKELKRKIDQPPSSSSTYSLQEYSILIDKLVSCYDNAISILLENEAPLVNSCAVTNYALEGSPTSEVSHLDSTEHVCKHVNKKRKNSGRWSEQVNVCGVEINDGYYWRKYGQKDILGANYPRAYYRCTHRYTQGCLATKQVQQMDKNPSTTTTTTTTNSQVVYKGTHTCTQQRHILKVESQQQLVNITNVEPETNAVETDHRFFVDPQRTYSPPTNDFLTSHSLLSPDINFPPGDIDLLIDDDVDFDYRFLGAPGFF